MIPPKGIDPRGWEGAVEDVVYDIEVDYSGYFDKGKLELDILALISQAIEAEREECAKIAYVEAIKHCSARDGMRLIGHPVGFSISQAIRNRSNTTTERNEG